MRHCHNLQREDAKITVPDPEARAKLIREQHSKHPDKRDGSVMFLATGTTLGAAVNREAFYNGYYKKYHRRVVAGGRRMDPGSLADAILLCQ